jgi:hypothetical protein
MSRGPPEGSEEDNGISDEMMGCEIDAVSIACVPGAETVVLRLLGWAFRKLKNPPFQPVDGVVPSIVNGTNAYYTVEMYKLWHQRRPHGGL